MPEFLEHSALKTMMDNFTLAKADLYRQFKIAYDNDIGMEKYEELSAKMREVCETQTRVNRLFNSI